MDDDDKPGPRFRPLVITSVGMYGGRCGSKSFSGKPSADFHEAMYAVRLVATRETIWFFRRGGTVTAADVTLCDRPCNGAHGVCYFFAVKYGGKV